MTLVTNAPEGVTYRTSSKADDWSNGILGFWDDFSADGELTEMSKQYDADPIASLPLKKKLAPAETPSFTFFITWN